jgi:glycerate kinase
VAKRARKYNIPLIAIVGDIGDDIEKIYNEGIAAIFSINRVAIPLHEAKLRSKKDLKLTVDNMMRFMNCQ